MDALDIANKLETRMSLVRWWVCIETYLLSLCLAYHYFRANISAILHWNVVSIWQWKNMKYLRWWRIIDRLVEDLTLQMKMVLDHGGIFTTKTKECLPLLCSWSQRFIILWYKQWWWRHFFALLTRFVYCKRTLESYF